MYKKTQQNSFHLTVDEIRASKVCLVYSLLVLTECAVLFVLEELRIFGILFFQLRHLLHESDRIFFPAFYLLIFKTTRISENILSGLNNPTLSRIRPTSDWANLSDLTSSSRARFDTEMNSLVFDTLKDDDEEESENDERERRLIYH